MKIYAPVKNANGIYASVKFVNGVGETDNPRLIEWFKSHGYKVPIQEESVKMESKPIDLITNESEFVEINNLADEADCKPDFDNMNPLELREWAKAHGLGGVIKNTRNKEKLLELIRG